MSKANPDPVQSQEAFLEALADVQCARSHLGPLKADRATYDRLSGHLSGAIGILRKLTNTGGQIQAPKDVV